MMCFSLKIGHIHSLFEHSVYDSKNNSMQQVLVYKFYY